MAVNSEPIQTSSVISSDSDSCEYDCDFVQSPHDSHQQDCSKNLMKCPNHCDVGCLTRKEMVVHLEKCPLAIVKCPFAVVGCDSVVRRQERMGHMKEAVGQHVECNKEAISELIRAKTGLEEQLKAKEHKLADIQRAIDEKSKELDEIRKEAKEKERSMQESIKQLKEMFEQELQRLREEVNVGVFSNRSFANDAVSSSIFTAPKQLGPTNAIKPVEQEKIVNNQTIEVKPFALENFEPTVKFKPLVNLSDVEVTSGEESDIELFSNKAKLYRFDKTLNQWKERGVGNIKILKHKNTGRIRILMRRDQVLKICCNHVIVKGTKLVPRDEKSYTWLTLGDLSDLSCGEPRAELFTVKFKLASTATAFQETLFNNFTKMTRVCYECSIQNEASVSQCVAYGGTPLASSVAGSNHDLASAGELLLATQAENGDNNTPENFESTAEFKPAIKLSSNLTPSSAPSSLFGQLRMPKFETGVPMNLSPAGESSVGVHSIHAHNIEEMPNPEAEANIYFDPVVSLPSSFSTSSGEENEDCLFTHKAKLFRYDGNLKVWKERGVGIIKILRNKVSGKGRVLMRREQVLKLCCNHYIVPGMNLKPGSLVDLSWIWFTSADLSEDTPQEEILCIKFKISETAAEFKKTFDMFASGHSANTSLKQDSFKDTTMPTPVDSDAVLVGEELPEPELVQLAEQNMLPPTFYDEPPCKGCFEEVVNKVVLPGNKIPQVKPSVGLFSSGADMVSFADLAAASTGSFGSSFGGSGFGNNQGSFAGAGKPVFAPQNAKPISRAKFSLSPPNLLLLLTELNSNQTLKLIQNRFLN